MELISGKVIADRVLEKAGKIVREKGLVPGLAVVLVGADPASEIYVGLKEKAAEKVGVRFERHALPETSSMAEVGTLISLLNERSDVHGIIVQLPLPQMMDTDALIATIAPKKDADGFHPETVAAVLAGSISTPPVFPRAILALLESTGVKLAGKKAIVFANSSLFARVMETVLQSRGIEAENSVALGEDEALRRLAEFDIIITAKGRPGFLKGSMVRPGAIIIDGGITRVGETVQSDADTKTFESVDGFITPVPGGVGPVTVAYLINRVVELSLPDTEAGSIL